MPQYWVVGAMWGGRDDQYEVFLKNGYWYLGWEDDEQPTQAKRRDQITKGDWIAIKRMLGAGSREIEIRSIGVVRKINTRSKRVYVDWLHRDLNKRVPAKGCFSTIHGPFSPDDLWTIQVFGKSCGKLSPVIAEEIAFSSRVLPEGTRRSVWVNAYERSELARLRCIAAWGTNCCVCGMSMSQIYGRVADGFIHVHHLVPLSEIKREYVVDPIKDMRPLCPNCHAIIHRREPPYTIEEMQREMKETANKPIPATPLSRLA